MLAQRSGPLEQEEDAVEGVDPVLRVGGRVGGFPQVGEPDLVQGEISMATCRRTTDGPSRRSRDPLGHPRLAVPHLSAGVPRATILPDRKRPAPKAASVAAAQADDTPTMLCPQACPRPGSASISQRNATAGFPLPKTNSARNAVSIPAIPRSTRNPLFSRKPARVREVRNSLSPSSAYPEIDRSMRRASGRSDSAIDRRIFPRRSIFPPPPGGEVLS
jgi:hypothetical protein